MEIIISVFSCGAIRAITAIEPNDRGALSNIGGEHAERVLARSIRSAERRDEIRNAARLEKMPTRPRGPLTFDVETDKHRE